MARPIKKGLDYFPFDVDFFQDIKIRKLIKSQGGRAVAVYALLLCTIYRNGYYAKWDTELPFIISEQLGYTEVYIREVIEYCLKIELLSKDMFEKNAVITSEGIQVRFFEAAKFRKKGELPYLLVNNVKSYYAESHTGVSDVSQGITPVSQRITPVSQGITPIPQGISTQSKVNKIKVKEEEEKRRSMPSSPPSGFNDVDYKFNQDHFIEQFLSNRPAIQSLMTSFGFTAFEQFKEACLNVMSIWSLTGHMPTSYADAADHLIKTLRKRAADTKKEPRKPAARPVANPQIKSSAPGLSPAEESRIIREGNRKAVAAMGYDPDKVQIWQATNPDWRAKNPPQK
ncbi:DUF4373 domain-containing protein [Turicimonas muris]|uniref:DUF4373 domain-containing protein n=1 Tax=Turicimonas muris TaxID=1796652 RepID=UPI00272A2BAC|nr:DUF4373 domain-containing protein [Turicimonas muris]